MNIKTKRFVLMFPKEDMCNRFASGIALAISFGVGGTEFKPNIQ